MITEAIILAGGFGTRLQSVVSDLPKPMAPVNGIPFLDYQLLYLKNFGIKKVILSVGHLHEKIISHYKNNFNGVEIDYAIETSPLGTGGGIRIALEKCKSNSVLVLNGDSFFDVDLTSFFNLHTKANADCSLALRKVENASRYGTVHFSSVAPSFDTLNKSDDAPIGMSRINSFQEKNSEPKPGLINGGVYLLNKDTYLQATETNKNFSIEKDFFEKKIDELNIFGFEYKGYFIDIGIPEDYTKAQDDFKGFKYK
ncbi:MAG: nucleotidyltransferase family protein [Bacteroidia bacterium]|nr:nucleotidyltransferase family protein [Bacteroidia bacterium]